MSSYLFIGGPLDGEYREVEDPPPTCVPYLSAAPWTSEYQPYAIPYIALPADTADGTYVVYTVFDEAELSTALRCPVCVSAGIYSVEHLPYSDARPGDDYHGQFPIPTPWNDPKAAVLEDIHRTLGVSGGPFGIDDEFPTREPQTFTFGYDDTSETAQIEPLPDQKGDDEN
jgi:hypothetical protein